MKKIIGFIFADEMEFKPFSDYALERGGELISSFPFNIISFDAGFAQIFACESGIGKVNSGAAAVELIRVYKVEYIMSAGLSGAVSGLKKEDVVAGTSYAECDFDLRAFGYELGQKPDGGKVYEAPIEMLEAAMKIEGMQQGRLGTGDFFLTDKNIKKIYQDEFSINAFDMESGAIAAVCAKYKIPFMSIRKISDDADDAAVQSYRKVNNLCEKTLTEIIMKTAENLMG